MPSLNFAALSKPFALTVLLGSGVLTACLPTPQDLMDGGPVVDSDSGFSDAGPPPDAGPAPDAGPLPSVALSMNAVAVLFPLPATGSTGLMTLGTPGRGGPLLSQAHFAAIPAFSDNPLPELAYGEWRIVSARIDPCFPTLALLASNPAACRRQLRLVAQPHPEERATGIDDNAIHLLYDLSPAQFDDLARRWVEPLKNQQGARQEPLGVSPTLRAQGLEGAYGQHLRSLIVEFAGPETLTQLTFMEGRGVAWQFGGFRITGASRTALPIAALALPADQQVTTAAPNAPFAITPASAFSEALAPLAGHIVFDSSGMTGMLKLDAPEAEVRAALQSTFDVDNPRTAHHADNVDCSSCHIANRARARAVRAGGQSLTGLNRYLHPFRPLEPSSEVPAAHGEETTMQRAFGYLNARPVINPRVIHEAAEVADTIERLVSAP